MVMYSVWGSRRKDKNGGWRVTYHVIEDRSDEDVFVPGNWRIVGWFPDRIKAEVVCRLLQQKEDRWR